MWPPRTLLRTGSRPVPPVPRPHPSPPTPRGAARQTPTCGETGGDVAEGRWLHSEILLRRGGSGREGSGGGRGSRRRGGGGRGGRRQWRTSPPLRGRRAQQRVEIQSPFQSGSARHGRGAGLGWGQGREDEGSGEERGPEESLTGGLKSVKAGGGAPARETELLPPPPRQGQWPGRPGREQEGRWRRLTLVASGGLFRLLRRGSPGRRSGRPRRPFGLCAAPEALLRGDRLLQKSIPAP